MLRSNIFFSLVFLLMTAFTLPAFAEEPNTLASEGVANIQGNAIDKARKAAIQDAKQRAVEHAIMMLIGSQKQVENHQLISDKILSRTGGYIKKYRVTGENVDSGLLRVRIKAVIAFGRLADDLSAIGLHPVPKANTNR